VVRLPFTFPPLLPRKHLKRFRISLHNGSHQQSETDLYWSLGGRSTRKTPKMPPSLSPSSPADYSRPTRFSASTDPVFLHVTATSNSGTWNSDFNHLGNIQKQNEQDQFPIPIHVTLPRHLSRSTSHSSPILRTRFRSASLSSPTSRSASLSSPISSNLFPIHDSF
jgi:hypothetical protein